MPPTNHPEPDHRAAVLGSDASFRLLVESVEDYGIILLDRHGNVASWNPGAARLSGYRADEVMGKHVSYFYPQEARDRQLPEREIAEASRNGRFEDEGWRVRKDGSRFWANVVISALLDGGGEIIGFAKLTRDLTARKNAEDEIHSLNAQLERRVREQGEELSLGHESLSKELAGRERAERDMDRFFNLSLDMICIAGLDGFFKRLNPAWEKALGYTIEELLARPFVEFIHPDDRSATREIVRELDEGTEVVHFENRYRHKDGTYRWFAWKAPAIPPGQDYLYATARDVTWRRENEARLATLLQRLDLATHAALLGIWDWDIVKDELFWDERMYELYGVRKEDFGGAYEAWLKGVHRDDRSRCDAAIQSALRGEKEYDIDFRVRWPGGTLRVIKANGQVTRDAAGKPLRMTGINYDITDRRKAEQRVSIQYAVSKVLAESETLAEATPRLVQAIAEAVDARVGAIWRVDPAANVLRCVAIWHKAGTDMADFEKQTRDLTLSHGSGLPGRVWQSGEPVWVPDLMADSNFARADAARAAGLQSALGAPIRSGRSFVGVLEFFTEGVHAPDSDLLEIFGGLGSQIGQFIERRQAEEALRGSQERLRLALDAAQIGDWELDLVTKAARRSLRHDQIFGYEELLPEWTFAMFLEHVHPEDRGRVEREFQESVAAGRDWYFECRIIRTDASVRWIWARGSIIKSGSGNQMNMIGMVRDITDRKQAEEQLRQLSVEAVHRATQIEAANNELEAFSYSVSHDLRAPLRHVQGYVELLKKAAGDSLPEKAKRHLDIITDASKQMGQLIDDLLAFSRIGRAEIHRAAVNLDEIVQVCLGGLELETRNRHIAWKFAPLPIVVGDRAMLRQVFANLMGNAVKYTRPRDPAEIEIGCAGRENGRAILFIRDNGVGFDMQFVGKLFGVFQRLHAAEEFEGTGIGLANVRRIITRHGGRIWPEAEAGKGATFFFTLEEASKPGLANVTP